MDVSVAEQMLDELLPSLEALEAQSGAIVQFLRDKGIATDEQLAPFLERARSASNVRWLAVRLRMNRLLAPAVKTGEETKKTTENMKEEPAERAQKPTQEAGELAEERSSGKEVKEETSKHPEKSAAGTKTDVEAKEEPKAKGTKEQKGSKNNTTGESTEKDAA